MGTSSTDESDKKPDRQNNRRGHLINSLVSSELDKRARETHHRRGPHLTHRKAAIAVVLLALTFTAYTGFLPVSRILSGLTGSSNCISSTTPPASNTDSPRVALIDQLSLQYPDPGFAQSVERMATTEGYGYDYFSPTATTLDFFLNLPNSKYSVLILRTHGSGINAGDKAAIATSEAYSSNQRVIDQLLDRLIPMDIDGKIYFALTPQFITEDMCGRFPGTMILAMYCSGGGWTELARAFVNKGAGAFIGWSGRVTVDHTDLTFQALVDLLLRGYPPASAVQIVMDRIGPDPWTGSRLIYHI